MYRYNYIILLLILLSTACAVKPKKPFESPAKPLEFTEAIRYLTNSLLRQLENQQIMANQLKNGQLTKTNIVLKPFINEDTGETVNISKNKTDMTIEDIIIAEVNKSQTCVDERCATEVCQPQEILSFSQDQPQCPEQKLQKRFAAFSIERMTQKSLPHADYVMYGVIRLEPYQAHLTHTKHYRVYSSVVDQETKKIAATANVWIADDVLMLNNQPMSVYRDSFLYLKDRGLEYLLDITIAPEVETIVDRSERDFVDAILFDAATAYENEYYQEARDLYHKATQQPGGEIIEAYAGLYQSYYKLNNLEQAKKAFAKMVELGAETGNLNTKFLFKVNSTEFGSVAEDTAATKELIEQYPLQLHQIGKYFSQSEACLLIAGHSSHTGNPNYNRQLSLSRAQKIQQLLEEDFSTIHSRIMTEGKGFDECIVCTGSDDEIDAVDRRVEFKAIDCDRLLNEMQQ